MATLFVHIGTHKTGTTTLQQFLYENRQKLVENNLIYPEFGLHPGLKGHHPIAFKLAGRNPMGQMVTQSDIERVFGSLNRVLKEQKDVLLSSEDFGRLSLRTCPNLPSILKAKVSQTDEFRIIVYLRRQDLFLRSYYGHIQKGYRLWRSDLDLRYARRNIYIPYSNLLERWAGVFGRENIVVRSFEAESMINGDLIEDFCAQIGQRDFRGDRAPVSLKLNTAFARRELEAMEFIMDSVSGPSGSVSAFAKRFVKRYSDTLQLAAGGQAYMSPSLARHILEMSSTDNHRIAQAYLGRNHLFKNERVSNRQAPPQMLNEKELFRIEELVETELQRLNTKEAFQEYGNRARAFQALRMRSRVNRKQFRIGSLHISNGRLLRMSELCIKRLWSKLNL